MRCPKCKKKVADGQQFCIYCGTPIPPKTNKKLDKKILIPVGVAGACGIAVLGAVLLTNPQQTSAGKLEKKIEAGNRYLESADYEKAEVAFNEALSIDKKSSDAALGLAKVCNEKKDPDGALKYLTLANQNLEDMSKKEAEDKKIDWEKKTEEYQKTYDTTNQLFLAAGNEKQAEYVSSQKEEATKTLYVIVQVNKEEISLPKTDDNKSIMEIAQEMQDEVSVNGNKANGAKEKKATGNKPIATSTATPTPEPTAAPTATPTTAPTSAPDDDFVDGGDTDGIIDSNDPASDPTQEPQVTEPPVVTEIPVVTVTEAPEVTEAPVVTEMPAVTEAPEVTETPAVTEPPAVTEAPAVTEEPEVTVSPEPTVEPVVTEAPNDNEGSESPQNPEEPENPEITSDQEVPAVSQGDPSEILYNYVEQNILPTSPLLENLTASYDWAAGEIYDANGTVSYQVEDLDGDGNPELLVVNLYNGAMGFDIYRVKDSQVVLTGSIQAYTSCVLSIVPECNYGMTQVCFLKDEGGTFSIGIASNSNGNDAGTGGGVVQTDVELYTLAGDNIVMKDAVVMRNGTIIRTFTGNDTDNGGTADFAAALNTMGMDGSWISESADLLASMDLRNNPGQSVSGVPDPLKNGMAAIENGVQDVAYVNGLMEANTGIISLNILDHPSTEDCAGSYQEMENLITLPDETAEEAEQNGEEQSAAENASEGENPEEQPAEDPSTTESVPEDSTQETTDTSTEAPAENAEEVAMTEYGIPEATADGTYYNPEDDGAALDDDYWGPEPAPGSDYTLEENNGEQVTTIPSDDSQAAEGGMEVISPEENQGSEVSGNATGYEENGYAENGYEEDTYDENAGSEEVAASPDELLEAYVNENIWPMYTQITSQAMSYDYGTGSVMGLDGVLGVHKADLDGDTLPELLVIRVQSGQIVWDIYRVNNSAVELASTTVPCTNGLGQAMSDMSYEMSQTCFLKDQGGSFMIGVVSNYSNVEEGQGTPSVRTSLETYSVYGGTCSMVNAVTILNGSTVYFNNDRGTAAEGGSDSFMASAASAGLSGNWITESTSVLDTMDLANNPGQDVSAVPDPVANGLASKEGGVQDLVIMSGRMDAGTGSLNVNIQDNTNLY